MFTRLMGDRCVCVWGGQTGEEHSNIGWKQNTVEKQVESDNRPHYDI